MSDKPSIQDLTKLVMFSGRISKVHLKNLNAFPFIFFNGVVDPSNLNHDISTVRDIPSSISYDLTINQENDFQQIRYKALENAVRSIFWKEVIVVITINGEEVFKSE